MIDKITYFSKGIFKIEEPEVILKTEMIVKEINAGKDFEDYFQIETEEGKSADASIMTLHPGVELKKIQKNGRMINIIYTVHKEYLIPDRVIHGEFLVLSSGKEQSLPFEFHVKPPVMESSMGPIKDLFQFANLARKNWEEAVHMFLSDEFANTVLEKHSIPKRVYEELKLSISPSQAMEEFLIFINKKKEIELSLPKQEIEIEYDCEDISGEIEVAKSTWGYVEASVTTDAEFIYLPKKSLTMDDFVGGVCKIPYVIELDKIRNGKEKAHITISYIKGDLTENILVKNKDYIFQKNPEEKVEVKTKLSHKIKRWESQLEREYLDFRIGKIGLEEYVDFSVKNADELIMHGEKVNLYRLVRLHMYILSRQQEKTEQELEEIRKEKNKILIDDASICYYNYLIALYKRDMDIIHSTVRLIREKYAKNPKEFFFFWMLIYLDEEYSSDPERMLREFEAIYEMGNNSPMLYYEVCELLNDRPELLTKLTKLIIFAVKFGVVNQYLSKNVLDRYAKLAAKMKEYHPVVFQTLTTMYEQNPTNDSLSIICGMIIKGQKTQKCYHKYFEDGINASLKMIGISEYFIKTMDKSSYPLLPESVVLYFEYEDKNLTENEIAYLYANLLTSKEQYFKVYDNYINRIKEFTLKQMKKGRMSEALIILYQTFLDKEDNVRQCAAQIPNIIFKQCFICKNPNISYVYVRHEELKEMQKIALFNGKCYVDKYTDHVTYLLEDANKKRYVSSVEYEVAPVFEVKNYIGQCFEASTRDYRVLLYLQNDIEVYQKENQNSVAIVKQLMNQPEIRESTQKKALCRVIDFYYNHYEGDILEKYLLQIDLDQLLTTDREKVIGYLVSRKLYDLAFAALQKYGVHFLTIKNIRDICTYEIKKEEKENPFLLKLCFLTFIKGKYNETILTYLVRYLRADIKNLYNVWKAAKEYDINLDKFEENLVSQMIYVEDESLSGIRIFESFYKKTEKRLLVNAYLQFWSYQYFVKEKIPSGKFFELLENWYEREKAEKMSMIALLYYYSQGDYHTEQQKKNILTIMDALQEENLIFPFYHKFESQFKIPKELYVKSFVTYRSKPGKDIRICVCRPYENKEEKSEEYKEYKMQEIIPGYYQNSFVLFSDERMQYYIIEKDELQDKFTESDTLTMQPYITGNHESRFENLNMMIDSLRVKDDQTLELLMSQYLNSMSIIEDTMTVL